LIRFYAEIASPEVVAMGRLEVLNAAAHLVELPVLHRPGEHGTREYPLSRFPYTLLYRATAQRIRIVRVLHQARDYFNE
jgi:plasmid stabilization system protein ParE